jgi:DNA-binding Lrp family transcriptional regulator
MRDVTTLDGIDRGLVHALHLDARAPFTRIAEVLGTSTQTVVRRYRRMRAGAGLRVVGLADPHRSQRQQWIVRFTAAPRAAQDIARALAARPDTSWVRLTSGGTEIVAIVQTTPHGTDPHALLLHDVPRTASITAVSAHYLLHLYLGGPTTWRGRLDALTEPQQRLLHPSAPPTRADPPSPTAGDQRPPTRAAGRQCPPTGAGGDQRLPTGAGGGYRPVTEADQRLLGALGRDGRASLAELAGVTGWSAATVARRIERLRGTGALFFDVEVDDALLGVGAAALLWMSVAPAELDRVATALAGHPELAVVAATTGPTNLLATALCPDPEALHHYLTRRLALPAITRLETAPVLRTLKAVAPPVTPSSARPG